MAEVLRVAVLVSGSGSNLQALLDRFNSGTDRRARVARVIASRPGIRALERASAVGVASGVLPATDVEAELARAMLAELARAEADLAVLAGFLRLVPSSVVEAYWGRMINIHPALLPAFGGAGMYGRRVHEAVLRSGARLSGVTIHFVDQEFDRGAIITQWPVPVQDADDAASLAARVLKVEHRVLPSVVGAFADGAFELQSDGRCRWSHPWFCGDEFTLTDEA